MRVCTGLAVLDDDSGKLGEIVELFSDMTPAIKVEKLIKVRYSHGIAKVPSLYMYVYFRHKQRFPHCTILWLLERVMVYYITRSVDVGVKNWRVFQSHVMI